MLVSFITSSFNPRKRLVVFPVLVTITCLTIIAAWSHYTDRLAAGLFENWIEYLRISQYKVEGFAIAAFAIGWLILTLNKHGKALDKSLAYSLIDPLTGLSNRVAAEKYLAGLISKSSRTSACCAVILLDVHQLSRINHSLGRSSGDILLKQSAQRINFMLKQPDMVARLGGDRFLVVLNQVSGPQDALKVGMRIQQAFDSPFLISDTEIEIDMRGGIALAPNDGIASSDLIAAAERALKRNRKKGKGLDLADDEDFSRNSGALRREMQLRRAIRNQEITIALQPQIDLRTFDLVGAEALARWKVPNEAVLMPNEFIPLAESLGIIEEITKQVLSSLVHHAVDWQNRELRQIQLSVNLSGLDLKSDRIIKEIESFLRASALPPHLLTLEITESWMMDDPHLSLGLIHKLRAMGPRIAIDDFGSGFSALSQLIDFPFDYVKFDRCFVANIDKSPKKAQLLLAIQRMATTLGARTVAEGVETLGELKLLREMGIDEAQGYLFSKPMDCSDFEPRFLDPAYSPFHDYKSRLEKLGAGSSEPDVG